MMVSSCRRGLAAGAVGIISSSLSVSMAYGSRTRRCFRLMGGASSIICAALPPDALGRSRRAVRESYDGACDRVDPLNVLTVDCGVMDSMG